MTAAASSATTWSKSTKSISKPGGSRGAVVRLGGIAHARKTRNHNVCVCCHGAGKRNTQICTSGSAWRPSESAARPEHLGPTATVSVASMFSFRVLARNERVPQSFAASVACAGGSERPCHGNGVCDGDGTRGGDGTCSCNHGYAGEFCLDCTAGHFSEARNDTFSLCTGDSRTVGLVPDARSRS